MDRPLLLRALAGETITLYGDGRQVRDVLFVEDLVEAFLAAERQLPGISGTAFNVGGGPENTLSLLELLDLIAELTGRRPEVDFAPWRAGDQRYYVSDTRRLQRLTGWRPQVGVKLGVRRLLQWLRRAFRARRRPARPGGRPRHPGARRTGAGSAGMSPESPLDVVLFCHSLVSDWNHGNAHFLRGVCRALQDRGPPAAVCEPRDGWSRTHLLADEGREAEVQDFHRVYPHLASRLYDLETLDLEAPSRRRSGARPRMESPEVVRRLGRASPRTEVTRSSSTTRTTGR